jgi:CspA family cold shock protein
VQQEKMRGIVKFFNNEKGYGFIKNNTNGEEVFVHSTGIIDKIKENDEVEFEMQQGRKGMNAVNVTLAK